MKKNITQCLVDFFKGFSTINKDAYKMYEGQKNLANGNKSKITNARLELVIVIFANCMVRLILPFALVFLMIVGFFKIFIPLLAIGALIYTYIDHLKDEKERSISTMQRLKIERYEFTANFSFESFRSLVSWLPIKTPQAMRDIFYNPHYIFQGVHEFMAFKLLKLSADEIDDEKLIFAQKMLSSLLEAKLFEEHNKNPYGHYTYKDVPSLYVVSIEDKGDHLLFQIAFINNDQIYYYLTNQFQTAIQRDIQTSPSDEDF